jgi:U3 small nucleolar ribonucleoprotein component
METATAKQTIVKKIVFDGFGNDQIWKQLLLVSDPLYKKIAAKL